MLFNHVGIDNPVEMNTVTIDGKRYYVTPQGNKYPSITTVISNNSKKQKSLAKWRARVGKEKAQGISTRSATRGTRYHKLVEDYLNNILDKTKYKDMPLPWFMFNTSQKVLDRINNIYLQEAALYSDVLKIAGRVDCIAEFCMVYYPSLTLRHQRNKNLKTIYWTTMFRSVATLVCFRSCMEFPYSNW